MAQGIRVDASDLKKVSRIAKEFSPELNKQLVKQLRAAGKVGADLAKQRILEMPTQGLDSRGLRKLIAQAVSVNVSTTRRPDIRIRVRKSAALQQIGAGGIAAAIDKGKWRHPLFGNRDYWYDQTGFMFFDEPILALKPEIVAMVAKALDDAIAIAKGRAL